MFFSCLSDRSLGKGQISYTINDFLLCTDKLKCERNFQPYYTHTNRGPSLFPLKCQLACATKDHDPGREEVLASSRWGGTGCGRRVPSLQVPTLTSLGSHTTGLSPLPSLCFLERKSKVLILLPGPSHPGHLGSWAWPLSQRLFLSLPLPLAGGNGGCELSKVQGPARRDKEHTPEE